MCVDAIWKTFPHFMNRKIQFNVQTERNNLLNNEIIVIDHVTCKYAVQIKISPVFTVPLILAKNHE